jgi:hypothetical protein
MQHHYDVIVMGESLSARIASLMLVRGGCRVLALRDPASPSPASPAWFFPSLFLERLLENFGGRSCYTPVIPFQVLTPEIRLEFLGRTSREEELQREFPGDFGEISTALELLQGLGRKLEEAFWHSGVPFFDLRSRLRFAGKRFRLGRAPGFSRPLSDLWKGVRQASAREALGALFSGLALVPLEKLSVAEGALLWHNAQKPDGLSLADFEELLERRYAQFHGEAETLSNVESLDCGAGRIRGVLQGGGRISSDILLLGTVPPEGLFQSGPAVESLSGAPRKSFLASIKDDSISPLLAPRFILGGTPALRLSFEEIPNGKTCLVETTSAMSRGGIQAEEIHSRLSPWLPFSRFRVEQQPDPRLDTTWNHSEPPRLRKYFPGGAGALKLGKNVFNCNSGAVFPSLGSTGEAFVGVSVANHLLGIFRKPS